MKLHILLKRKTRAGIQVKFETVELKNGSKAMSLATGDKRFVIHASLDNFIRFQKWDGKETTADILETGKKVALKDGNKLRTVRIRTDVPISNKVSQDKEEEEITF